MQAGDYEIERAGDGRDRVYRSDGRPGARPGGKRLTSGTSVRLGTGSGWWTTAPARPHTAVRRESVRADAGLGQGGRRQAEAAGAGVRPAVRSVPSNRADVQLLVRYRMLVTSRQIAGR